MSCTCNARNCLTCSILVEVVSLLVSLLGFLQLPELSQGSALAVVGICQIRGKLNGIFIGCKRFLITIELTEDSSFVGMGNSICRSKLKSIIKKREGFFILF